MTHILLIVLRAAPPTERVFILQSFIAEFGPIPDEIGPEVIRLIGEAP